MSLICRVPIGKIFSKAKVVDITGVIACLRYYAGWADKVHGKTIEVGINTWLQDTFSVPVTDH